MISLGGLTLPASYIGDYRYIHNQLAYNRISGKPAVISTRLPAACHGNWPQFNTLDTRFVSENGGYPQDFADFLMKKVTISHGIL